MNIRIPLLATAAIAAISVGGYATSVYALSDNSSTEGTSIVDKIASKFNLNADEVKAVFAADRAERMAECQADRAEQLATAVTNGDITQAQSDYITNALAEIETLKGDSVPRDMSDTVREQIRTKMDALRDWAKDNNVDLKYIGHGGHHGGFGDSGRGMRNSANSENAS